MGSHSILSCHSRLLSRIPVQLCWSPFRHWKVAKGIPRAFSSPGGQPCTIPGPLKSTGSHGNKKQDLKLRFLQSHSSHTTCITPKCSSGATTLTVVTGVATKIYFPSGSYSHPWYFWNLLLKQEETTEFLDYKKEKKNKAFQPISTVTSINSRFITVHTPTCPQHGARNAQTQQSKHSNENRTQHQGSWKYSCSFNRKTTKMITESGNTIKVALKCHL